MDNAATTRASAEVLEAMEPYYSVSYGNPSSLHKRGREARKAVEDARKTVAGRVKAEPRNIILTSGGTESNNLALKGVAYALRDKGGHIITTAVEHSSILNTCKWLEKQGYEVTYVGVDEYGLVDPGDVGDAVRDDTILVSVGHANNEVGTIQDIAGIGKITSENDVLFHTDACQSFTKTDLDVEKQHLDLVTVNSHKIHGPKGVGALYIREGVNVTPLLHGGSHEGSKRAGTENVAGIVGFAKAAEAEEDVEKLAGLRDRLIKDVQENVEDTRLNGHPSRRLCNNANITFHGVEGEAVILRLDGHGIACSTGSACSSHTLEPSHVLTAMGLEPEEAHGSVRMTLSRYNKAEEVDYTVEKLEEEISKLRAISPVKR